eukprot:Skav232494  [mRNA]  locus=scaffold3757:91032:92048:- [translate_table: standard]
MLADMSSALWRKLVQKHSQYPFALAAILDPEFPQEQKVHLLDDFFSLSPCCLEQGTCVDLKTTFADIGVQACLQPGSRFFQTLVMLFTSKTSNVELENNFARSSSSRAYLRGRRHSSATMSVKHLISELKHQHLISRGLDKNSQKRLKRQAQYVIANGGIDPGVQLVERCQQARRLMATPKLSNGGVVAKLEKKSHTTRKIVTKQAKKVNGWMLFLQDAFKESLVPNESKSDRYTRIRAAAKNKFQDAAIKTAYRLKAQSLNKHLATQRATEENSSNSANVTLCQLLSDGGDKARFGPWGLGDIEYPLSKELLEQNLSQQAFVKRNSEEFCVTWIRLG